MFAAQSGATVDRGYTSGGVTVIGREIGNGRVEIIKHSKELYVQNRAYDKLTLLL